MNCCSDLARAFCVMLPRSSTTPIFLASNALTIAMCVLAKLVNTTAFSFGLLRFIARRSFSSSRTLCPPRPPPSDMSRSSFSRERSAASLAPVSTTGLSFMRDVSVTGLRQTGHGPVLAPAVDTTMAMHSAQNTCPQGVQTGESTKSMHTVHSASLSVPSSAPTISFRRSASLTPAVLSFTSSSLFGNEPRSLASLRSASAFSPFFSTAAPLEQSWRRGSRNDISFSV